MKVKICGITNLEDALAAEKAGADYIGFIFADSPRKIDKETARTISLKIAVPKVGVFVNTSIQEINSVIDYIGLDFVQLHGEEPPEFCRKLKKPVIKAFRITKKEDEAVVKILGYDFCYAILLDTYVPGKPGGTGKTFDWQLVQVAREITKLPIILSGGLKPDNIQEAIAIAHPDMVDVSSGVESSPGKKDYELMKKFIERAKN